MVIYHMICAAWFVPSAVVFNAYDVDGTRTLDRVGGLDCRDDAEAILRVMAFVKYRLERPHDVGVVIRNRRVQSAGVRR